LSRPSRQTVKPITPKSSPPYWAGSVALSGSVAERFWSARGQAAFLNRATSLIFVRRPAGELEGSRAWTAPCCPKGLLAFGEAALPAQRSRWPMSSKEETDHRHVEHAGEIEQARGQRCDWAPALVIFCTCWKVSPNWASAELFLGSLPSSRAPQAARGLPTCTSTGLGFCRHAEPAGCFGEGSFCAKAIHSKSGGRARLHIRGPLYRP